MEPIGIVYIVLLVALVAGLAFAYTRWRGSNPQEPREGQRHVAPPLPKEPGKPTE